MTNYLTRTVGVTFETGTLADNLILGNMSFEQLYILITLIITSVAVTRTVCKCMTIISKEKINNYSDGVKAFEGVLGSDVLGVVATLAALYIPTQILLLSCKYTVNEILNAEIFASVLIRILVTVVTMTLTVPTVLMLNEKEEK